MITPANPIRAAMTAGSLLSADAATPVCTEVAQRLKACAAATYLLSQVKRMDSVIAIGSLLPCMAFFQRKREAKLHKKFLPAGV